MRSDTPAWQAQCKAHQSRSVVLLPGDLNGLDVDVAEANSPSRDARSRAHMGQAMGGWRTSGEKRVEPLGIASSDHDVNDLSNRWQRGRLDLRRKAGSAERQARRGGKDGQRFSIDTLRPSYLPPAASLAQEGGPRRRCPKDSSIAGSSAHRAPRRSISRNREAEASAGIGRIKADEPLERSSLDRLAARRGHRLTPRSQYSRPKPSPPRLPLFWHRRIALSTRFVTICRRRRSSPVNMASSQTRGFNLHVDVPRQKPGPRALGDDVVEVDVLVGQAEDRAPRLAPGETSRQRGAPDDSPCSPTIVRASRYSSVERSSFASVTWAVDRTTDTACAARERHPP